MVKLQAEHEAYTRSHSHTRGHTELKNVRMWLSPEKRIRFCDRHVLASSGSKNLSCVARFREIQTSAALYSDKVRTAPNIRQTRAIATSCAGGAFLNTSTHTHTFLCNHTVPRTFVCNPPTTFCLILQPCRRAFGCLHLWKYKEQEGR